MSIVQKIQFKAKHDYFAGFLQYAIDECAIEGSVSREGDNIVLILSESDPVALERFADYTQKYLPHSIFLGDIETYRSDTAEPATERFVSRPYELGPCPVCLEELTDPASDRYLDDTIECRHYSNEETIKNPDPTYFSPHYNGQDTVLLCDPSRIDELFIMTDDEKKALFSIEKPTLKVTLAQGELKEMTGKSFVRLKAPYNIKSSLTALNAKESGIDTLFFDERENEPQLIIVQEHSHMIYDNRVSVTLENLHPDAVLNRFDNIVRELGAGGAIGACLSTKNGISFQVKNENGMKRVIEFADFDAEETFEAMRRDENRKRLLERFGQSYPEELRRAQAVEKGDIFASICAILGMEDSGNAFERLMDESLLFRGNGGLKIDMNIGGGSFDYSAMLGSIMSFRLAGTERRYLAYSIFEAYADMSISILGQLKREFKQNDFILMGDMFSNSVLFSRILSKFQISTPHFSVDIALDA